MRSTPFLLMLAVACGAPSNGSTTPDEPTETQPVETAPADGCEAHTYSDCPEGCTQSCVGSCDACNDCDGEGSCTTPAPPVTSDATSCSEGEFAEQVPEQFRRCESDADCTGVSVGCCPHERIIVATEHQACVAARACDQEPGSFACIQIEVGPPTCSSGLCE